MGVGELAASAAGMSPKLASLSVAVTGKGSAGLPALPADGTPSARALRPLKKKAMMLRALAGRLTTDSSADSLSELKPLCCNCVKRRKEEELLRNKWRGPD